MISRRTARILGEIYMEKFTRRKYNKYNNRPYYGVDDDNLYDYLYDQNYEAWFCNKAKGLGEPRSLREFIMKLHTGETMADATPNWTWQQRQRLGQQYLRNLAKDMLSTEMKHALVSNLELDGYVYRDGKLLASESDVLDAQEEAGALEALYTSLGLANKDTMLHHLKLSEDHYLARRWDDSISNSRKVLEGVLQEVAAAYSLRVKGAAIDQRTFDMPVRIREYLEREGLLEQKETEAVRSTYGLLSHTGGHPYMAENDQARLLRHLALTFSQFVMLRLEGKLKATP